jgi:hypothetical protein
MGVVGQRHAQGALPPGKRLGVHFIGAWVCPRAGLDGAENLALHRHSTSRLSSP